MLKDRANLSEEIKATRILSKGQIIDLTEAFSISGEPFSICVIPTDDISVAGVISESTTGIGITVNCKLINENTATVLPVYFNQWTEAAIREISADAIDTETYTVFYGSNRSES